jgi:hypothetical protein
MDRHLTDDELVLHYYGETSDAADARAASHVDGCVECRENLARLQRVLAMVDAGAPPAADAAFESRMWERLEPELQLAAGSRQLAAERSGYQLPATSYRLAWLAAVAVLVLAAFVAGRMSAPQISAPIVATVASIPAADRVLDVDLGDHLDRAEVALVGFLTRAEPAEGRGGAEDLIAANRLYRGTAQALGDDNVVTVLDELERALIEIAAAPEADAEEQDAVRAWIDSRDLLFKVRIIRDTLEDPLSQNERRDSAL